jgi:MoaA/NifB/PqqE/SkfB family radical SAM enzyme
MSKSICAYPWAGAAVRPDGTILPCCKFDHNKEFGNVFDQDPRSSDAWNNLRSKMILGGMLKSCESCYKEEQSGIESLRQQSLKFYSPINTTPIKLKQLEVSFNNLCNLACVHCSEEFSTKWYSEKVKHRDHPTVGITQHKFDYLEWDLSEVRYLKIIGGEPMMAQDKFIELLRRLDRANLNVIVATNATILPNDELKNLLESCAGVSFKVSLDGVGLVNNWIRWPSKFDDIEKSIDILETWWGNNQNIRLEFHSVIGVYNILYLENLVNYIKRRSSWDSSWDWIRYPSWQALNVMPNKIELNEELEKLSSQYNYLKINPFRVSIDRLYDPTVLSWNDFKFENERLERERNMSSPLLRLV